MSQQRFVVDGVPIAEFKGGFLKRFEMDAKDADAVAYGDVVVLVVVARVVLPTFTESKTHDVTRVNRFEVAAAKVAGTELGIELAEMLELDMDLQQQLPFPVAGQMGEPIPPAAIPTASQPAAEPSAPSKVPPAPVTVPRGVPVGVAAPGAGSHAHDEALRAFLGT